MVCRSQGRGFCSIADQIPVAVSLRVLKLARQPYYRWRDQPVAVSEVEQAYRANALHAAHLKLSPA